MRERQFPAASLPGFGLGLPARLAILGAMFFAEKVLLDAFVDSANAQTAQGLGEFVHIAQHWGFRFLVTFLATAAVFAYVRGGNRLESFGASVRASAFRSGWIFLHALLVAILVPVSYLLYRSGAASLPFGGLAGLWILLGAAAATAAVLAMAPLPLWFAGARALGSIWLYAAIAALLGTGAWHGSERLWKATTALTFELVKRVLLPIIPTLGADAATRVLSTDRFAVEVTEVCSGLEGMGLMLAFTVAWLLYFRREYIFPRALLLVPVGLTAMFGLNVLRIAALVLIGHAGFPDVAAYGFHSQAGWIAFNIVACGLVFFSRRSTWLSSAAVKPAAPVPSHNPTAAYLMPFLVILAAGAVSHAMSSGFEIFYPLRLLAGLIALALYRRKLAALDWRWSWRGPAVGLLVFLLWIGGAHFLAPEAAMPAQLAALSPPLRATWIASRIVAAVLTVPFAEELAYRGYLLRRLSSEDFESVPFESIRWPALAVTAVVFGLAHGALWLPGIAAGLAFGLVVVRRGSLGEAVAAHAATNALIAVGVLGFDQWQLW